MAENTADLHARFLMGNYATLPVPLVRGEGARVWDDAGKTYLDFSTGIAVNALGHAHPTWVARVREQAGKLIHVSNLFRSEPVVQLSAELSKRCGPGRALFCNSGAEANEALIKLSRLHGQRKAGAEGVCTTVVVAERAFHGRTFGGMSATPQEKIQKGFRPLLAGFPSAPLNDIKAWDRLLDAKTTAAALVETVQGEGGVFVADPTFLRELRVLCSERNILLLLDEIQCGIGRTGTFFAFEQACVLPDAIAMAKGLGAGFPMGAIWVAPPHDDLFTPGSHGTTFGGSPLAATAALATLEVIEKEGLLAQVAKQSPAWHAALRAVGLTRPDIFRELRGLGYMVGVAVNCEPRPIVAALREAGLLVVPAGENAIRFLPPLTATEAELAQSVDIFGKVLAGLPRA